MSSIQAPPIVPGYHISVDAVVFELMIHKALAELAKSGRRVDFESLSQYMTMRHVLRECVTIEAIQTCTVFSPNAVAE